MGGAASDPLHKDVYLTAVTVIPVLWLTAGLAARDVIWAVLHDYARLGGWLREKLHQVPTGQPSATLPGRAFGLLAHPTHFFGGLFLFGGVLGEIAALIALFGRYDNPVLLWVTFIAILVLLLQCVQILFHAFEAAADSNRHKLEVDARWISPGPHELGHDQPPD
jgi:hypothetical protein